MKLKLASECTDRYVLDLDSGSSVWLTKDELESLVRTIRLFDITGDHTCDDAIGHMVGEGFVQFQFPNVVLHEKCDPLKLATMLDKFLE